MKINHKKAVVTLLTAVASVFLIIPVHELGHALCGIICGGTPDICLVPNDTYIASTFIDYGGRAVSFGEMLFVSAGGYGLCLVIAWILLAAGTKIRSFTGSLLAFPGVIWMAGVFGQCIYTAVSLCRTFITGGGSIDDIVSVATSFPDNWLPCVLTVLLLLTASTAGMMYATTHLKKEFYKLAGEIGVPAENKGIHNNTGNTEDLI